jgi:hypothetical protein
VTGDDTLTTPVMICVYGKPKRKKTSDVLAAFPNALFIGVPSAISLVAENELGFTPAVYESPPQTLPELVHLLQSITDQNLAEQYGAIVIDDASHICKRSMLAWQQEAPKGRSGKRDRFYQYQQLNEYLLRLSSISRYLGCHLVMTFHERAPGSNVDGVFCPGGPDVPSRNQTEVLPSWCDINLRSMVDPTYPDPWFPHVYYCDPSDPEWITGDRTGVCNSMTPGNLREILRASASGYHLPRIPGLEWQEDVADQVAAGIDEGCDVVETVSAVSEAYADVNLRHLRWACQDGIARAILRKRLSRGLFTFPDPQEKVSSDQGGSSLPPPPPAN